jgi:hypothetical protein
MRFDGGRSRAYADTETELCVVLLGDEYAALDAAGQFAQRSLFCKQVQVWLLSLITAASLCSLLFHPLSGPYIYTPALVSALLAAVVWRNGKPAAPPQHIPRFVLVLAVLLPLVGLPFTLASNRIPPPDHQNASPFGVVAQ